MIFNLFAPVFAAVKFVFTSQSLFASALRFVGGSILSQLLAGKQNVEGPRLSDLRVQVSTYGQGIPRLYGQQVRIAGNVIDKSDLIETRHKKKKKVLGITVATQKYYTYSVDLVIALAEGELPDNALVRILANGKTIFQRSAAVAPPTSSIGGSRFNRTETQSTTVIRSVRFYPGSATQGVDPTVQGLHPGESVPAYRHTAYVVLEGMELADFGNSVPNLEFFVETGVNTVSEAVKLLGTFAEADIITGAIVAPLHGYVVSQANNVWGAIEPLAGTFAFDLVSNGAQLVAKPRGRSMVAVIPESDLAARPSGSNPVDVANYTRADANKHPDEVTVTYVDIDRDYQPNTQRAFRNEGFSKNKMDMEVAVAMSANDARGVAARILWESVAASGAVEVFVSERWEWLNGGDVVGITTGMNITPFRLVDVTKSPNGVIRLAGAFDDPLSYVSNVNGASGGVPPNVLSFPGETVFQPMDAPTLEDENDTGFYFVVAGTGTGWRGASVSRAEVLDSPVVYDLLAEPALAAIMGECTTTLADGPTDVFDYANTLVIDVFGDEELETVSESDVLIRNANFAWVGDPDGQGGEYINFTTAALTGSPNQWTISGLLRGRRGTEHAVSTHGSGERFVLVEADPLGRLDFGPIDWNLSRDYLAVSVPLDDDSATPVSFTNTGEGKRPYAPVHLGATRNGANDDILITWTRRTRSRTPGLGLGPVPLGEETEAYEVDIIQGGNVIRTLTATEPQVNYVEADQTTDGHTLGDPVEVAVYQMSGVRGRGRAAEGTV
jgi:hypothetical protein